ncbi:MAG: PHP-associated domain-containing protein [Desulfomonilaceae bacterium]
MRIDLHCHTHPMSSCSEMSPDEMMLGAVDAKLDGICLTEHNRVWSPEEADALSQKYGMAVFRGIEVTTTGGDIIVYGVDTEPHGLLTPQQLKQIVAKYNGVAIAAHPFRGFLLFGFGILQMSLNDALDNPTLSHVDAVEICNGKVTDDENDFARQVADALNLIKVGGSDAHSREAVGTCVTNFDVEINNERDLITAIMNRQFSLERCK